MSKNKCNVEIRVYLTALGVTSLEVSKRLGISKSAFSKRMAKELPETQKKEIMQLAREIALE